MNEQELKEMAYEMASNNELFSEAHPYVDHIPFLGFLRDAYAEEEAYEVSAIIKERIEILSKKQEAVDSIVDLVSKINMLNEIQKNKG